jgi:predicted metalloprotease with PDZ domain
MNVTTLRAAILLYLSGCQATCNPRPATVERSLVPAFWLLVSEEALRDRRAQIEITVPAEVTAFEAPLSYAGAPMFIQYLSDLEALDARGNFLPVTVRDNTVLVAPAGEIYTLRYTYNVPQARSGEIDQSLPTMDASHARFDNNLTFLAPRGLAGAPAELLVGAPEHITVATSWGDGGSERAGSVTELISGMIVLGEYRYSTATLGGTSVTFALRGEYDDALLKKQFAQVLESQQAIAGPFPSSRLLVVVQDTVKACCKGTALTNAFLVNIPSGTALEPFNFPAIGTISHELFHQWNLRHVTPADPDGAYLLTEGFTNYFAVATLVHAKLIPMEGFARFLWRYRGLLEGNPEYPRADYEAIQAGFRKDDAQLIDLAYTKGPFVAVLLDRALRTDTGGAVSVVSWFRALSERFGGKPGYRLDDLRALIVELTGAPTGEAATVFERAFIGGGALDLDALFTALGIECSPTGDCKLAPLPEREAERRAKLFSARL